jgi:hypothetical protein
MTFLMARCYLSLISPVVNEVRYNAATKATSSFEPDRQARRERSEPGDALEDGVRGCFGPECNGHGSQGQLEIVKRKRGRPLEKTENSQEDQCQRLLFGHPAVDQLGQQPRGRHGHAGEEGSVPLKRLCLLGWQTLQAG